MAEISRTWATIVYQESCKETWIDDLESLKIPCYISPLHDQDVQENNPNELKKPHFHVLLMFQGQKNRKNIMELVQAFGGVGAEKVEHKDAYAKYLCHLCSPGKHVYDIKDVLCLNGAKDYISVIEDSELDKYAILMDIIDFINEYNIFSFADLSDYARQNRKEWFRVIVGKHSYFLWQYFSICYNTYYIWI